MQNNQNEISPATDPSEPQGSSVAGEQISQEQAILRATREAKQLSVGDVAYSLKVSPRVIETLETGEWGKLPGRTFVVGILRAYGRLLDISVDTLVDAVPGGPSAMKKNLATTSGAPKSALKSVNSHPRERESKRQSNRMLKFGLLMILFAVILAYALPRGVIEDLLPEAQSFAQRLIGMNSEEVAAPAAQATSDTEQSATAPAAPADQQTQSGTGTLELRFAAPAWVEVRDHTGRIIYSQLNAAGTTQFITGAAPLDVMIGNAKQVQARWRDEPLKLDKLSGDDVARQTLR